MSLNDYDTGAETFPREYMALPNVNKIHKRTTNERMIKRMLVYTRLNPNKQDFKYH